MEFLRFGSSIPGTYWGCCACDIIQNFNFDPDEKSSIQLVDGDGASPVVGQNGKTLFAGPTYKDIFLQRIRSGTFEKQDMPNHAFLAIITQNQISGLIGMKWLTILKETGFEFIRTISNSVYGGQTLAEPKGKGSNLNYLFGLFRNIGRGAPEDTLTPPEAWTSLPRVVDEAWEFVDNPGDLVLAQSKAHREIWDRIGKPKFLTEEEIVAAGAPVILAGERSNYPQQPKKYREIGKASQKPTNAAKGHDPFASGVFITE